MTLITIRIWLALMLCLIVEQAMTATLTEINIANSPNQSTITLAFHEKPIYTFFSLHNPERMVVDIYQSSPVQRLPFYFNGENVIKRIRTSTPVNKKKSLRLVCDLTCKSGTQADTRQVIGRYNVVFTVTSQTPLVVASRSRISPAITNPGTVIKSPASTPPVVVAIDAGHGGQDPGASGPNGLHEKNVTIAIARKLKALLDKDLMFKPVLTRDENYFISVMGRSDVARKNGASVLISIHADAAPNRSARGASVWVLSNRRANSEMANWLEQNEKQSELLGGAGDLLIKSQADPYLSQAVLDLQFGHSQRVGYDIAVKVLSQLRRIGSLHKRRPEHASLGVLRSPDIPSLLVETGFLSNTQEERLLGSSAYQDEIANALYLGLRKYFRVHPLQMSKKLENRSQEAVVQSTSAILASANARHTVVHGETLFGITRQYSISMTSLRALNNLKKDSVWVGQRLRIPSTDRLIYPPYAAPRATVLRHKVARGDTLISIAARYDISAGTIRQANKMKRNSVILGQTLTIPHT